MNKTIEEENIAERKQQWNSPLNEPILQKGRRV
jgi:hypothetical protein